MKIPDGWKKERLSNLFEVQLGKMVSEKARIGKQYPYLANFNVRWGNFNLTKINHMAFSEREREKYTLRYGDLLICEGGEIGRCAVWREYHKEIYYQKALHRLRPISGNSSTDYLSIHMRFLALRGRLIRLVGESSIAHLTREKLLGLNILLPPLPEQKAIADLLLTWDEAIEKTEQLIQAKEKRFKGLLHKLITEPQMDTDKHRWKKVKLGDVCKLYQPQTISKNEMFESGNYKVFGANGVIGFYGRYNHEESEIAITCRGATCGNVNITEPKSWITGNAMVAKSNPRDIKQLFLYFSLLVSNMKSVISGAAQPQITRKDLAPLLIRLPPLNEQQCIADTLTIAQQEINLLKKLVEEYKTQKRGLMQKLLTGEWRMKTEIIKKYKEGE